VGDPAAVERVRGELGAVALGLEPRLAFAEQLSNLGEQRLRRRAFALERLDPRQPLEHRPCLVHDPNVAGESGRNCVGPVTNELLSGSVPDFESSLAAARVAYERNDPDGALRRLDRARKAALKHRDEAQLDRVLDFADGVITRDERTEIERESLLYAVRQNLRQLTRRRALMAGETWVDPFPGLETPLPQTRTYMSTGLKLWIAIGVLVGILVIVLWIVGAATG
jgi:hypothetical protein